MGPVGPRSTRSGHLLPALWLTHRRAGWGRGVGDEGPLGGVGGVPVLLDAGASVVAPEQLAATNNASGSAEASAGAGPPGLLRATRARARSIGHAHLTVFGSRASRRPSPMKFTASTVDVMAIAAGTHCQGIWLRTTGLVASVIEGLPQLASGGRTPSPRKLRLLSSRTAGRDAECRDDHQQGRRCSAACRRKRMTRSAHADHSRRGDELGLAAARGAGPRTRRGRSSASRAAR